MSEVSATKARHRSPGILGSQPAAMTHALEQWGKSLTRRLFYPEGSTRTCVLGPYRGLRFRICSQMRTRMRVFYAPIEPDVASLLLRVVRPGMVLCNVGAHVGIHTLYMAKLLRRRGVVYAFEAWPENYGALVLNVNSNAGRVAEIVPVNVAVGDRTGTAPFAEGRTDGTHHFARAGDKARLLRCTTLDEAWDTQRGWPEVVLVDVEGNEMSVLLGAQRMIATGHPQFVLEHHGRRRARILVRWLRRRGYDVSPVGARHLHARWVGGISETS